MSPYSPGENLKVHYFFHSQAAFKGQLLEAERNHQKENSTYKQSKYFFPKYLRLFYDTTAWFGVGRCACTVLRNSCLWFLCGVFCLCLYEGAGSWFGEEETEE